MTSPPTPRPRDSNSSAPNSSAAPSPAAPSPAAPSPASPRSPGPNPSSRPRRKPRPASFLVGSQEFVQAGLSRFEVSDPYYFAISLGWRAFLLLFLLAELAINTVFALLYLASPGCIANARPGFTDAFFFSLETLATVGYGVMAPATTYGHLVSGTEIVTGLAFTAIMTGLLFVRFSKPKARIVYADHLVVAMHNGQPTLMLRIGNARATIMTNMSVSIYALVRQVSSEGRRTRSILELPLVRGRMPVFAILFTLMHVIDETSPLFGLDARDIEAQEIRLFLTVSAHDQAMGQTVTDVHTFDGTSILFGMRYADAIQATVDNRTVADYARISAIEADT